MYIHSTLHMWYIKWNHLIIIYFFPVQHFIMFLYFEKEKKIKHRRQCWCIQVSVCNFFFLFWQKTKKKTLCLYYHHPCYIRWKIYVILSSLRTGVKLLHSNYMVDYIPFVDFCTDVVISSFSYILFIRVQQRTCYCITCIKKWIYAQV